MRAIGCCQEDQAMSKVLLAGRGEEGAEVFQPQLCILGIELGLDGVDLSRGGFRDQINAGIGAGIAMTPLEPFTPPFLPEPDFVAVQVGVVRLVQEKDLDQFFEVVSLFSLRFGCVAERTQ